MVELKTERQRAIERNRQAATHALRQLASAIEKGQINEINVTWNEWGTRTQCSYTVPADPLIPIPTILLEVEDVARLDNKKPRTEGFHFVAGKIRGAATLDQLDDSETYSEGVNYPGTEIEDLRTLVDERRKQLRGEVNG